MCVLVFFFKQKKMVSAEMKGLGIAAMVMMLIVMLLVCLRQCIDSSNRHLFYIRLFGLTANAATTRRIQLLETVSSSTATAPSPAPSTQSSQSSSEARTG